MNENDSLFFLLLFPHPKLLYMAIPGTIYNRSTTISMKQDKNVFGYLRWFYAMMSINLGFVVV